MTYEEASQIAKDAVSNIRMVGSFCAQERILEMYTKKCKGATVNGIREGLIGGLGFGLSMCSVYLVYAATFYAGARFVEDGKATFPQVFCVRICAVSHAFTFSLMVLYHMEIINCRFSMLYPWSRKLCPGGGHWLQIQAKRKVQLPRCLPFLTGSPRLILTMRRG